jgi:hypothetical protein
MQQPVTQLLAQWRSGDEHALASLSAILYKELGQMAQQHLRRERANHTMQKTALVNERFHSPHCSGSSGLAEPRPFLRGWRRN